MKKLPGHDFVSSHLDIIVCYAEVSVTVDIPELVSVSAHRPFLSRERKHHVSALPQAVTMGPNPQTENLDFGGLDLVGFEIIPGAHLRSVFSQTPAAIASLLRARLSYEELTRLAKTRLAQNTLNYVQNIFN